MSSDRQRHIRLVIGMKQLLGCHQAVATRQRLLRPLVQGILLGLVVGFIAGMALFGVFYGIFSPTSAYSHSSADYKSPSSADLDAYYRSESRVSTIGGWLGGLGGLGVGGLLIWLRLRFWRKAQARAEQDLAAKAKALLGEFPQECQAWGGLPALRDRDLVKEMIRAVKAST